jgi:hypothetical protein
MPRPQFTEAEERYIEYMRHHEAGPRQVWGFYLPWIIAAAVLFIAGLLLQKPLVEIAGFGTVLFFLVRFVIYQCKPGWRVKPIIDKYEEVLSRDSGQPVAPAIRASSASKSA